MKTETYLSAIKKIENDPLSFLFSSHAEKRERQLSKFQRAVKFAPTNGGAYCSCDSNLATNYGDGIIWCLGCDKPRR